MIDLFKDKSMLMLLGAVFILLGAASVTGLILRLRVKSESGLNVVRNLNDRIKAWWIMCMILGAALLTGEKVTIILFAVISAFALREFITLTPTRRGDHRSLFWLFFVLLPLNYYLILIKWYAFFSVMIPVYGFLFLPTRSALAGDTEDFLERMAKIQWGLMLCVYCLSYTPALLLLEIKGYEGQNIKLLFFMVLVVQISDVMQYVFGKLFGRHKIAPSVSPNKTWEGFIGGVISATAIGTLLWWITPFDIYQACAASFLLTQLGFAGGLCMSAIKRDRGVKDFGTMIEGHGGIMDRIDSICFAAPIFFHLTRYFFT